MNNHWTDEEERRLEAADSFEELAEIALIILNRMAGLGQPIVQICGPMSTGGFGNLDDNMKHFERAVEEAYKRGLTVFNQLPFQSAMKRILNWTPDQPYELKILEVFYRRVFESGHIKRTLFLADWESSFGAVWERKLVAVLAIEIDEYPLEWLAPPVPVEAGSP